jgi:ubiquitin carboxyl-terminal hydrolase L3
MAEAGERRRKRWFPLEANPDVMNEYVSGMGMSVTDHSFNDIFGLDDELLAMVPTPVVAVLCLFPYTDEIEAYRERLLQQKQSEGQQISDKVYFMKQTVSNACGTVGIMHSIANNLDKVNIAPSTFLQTFFEKTAQMTPAQRAEELEGSDEVEESHGRSAQQGQSNLENLDTPINLHFVCFIHRDGTLYELDGTKSEPFNHGPTTAETLLQDTARVVRKLIELNPDNVNFNLIALSKN